MPSESPALALDFVAVFFAVGALALLADLVVFSSDLTPLAAVEAGALDAVEVGYVDVTVNPRVLMYGEMNTTKHIPLPLRCRRRWTRRR